MSEAYETLRGRTNFKLRAFARHDKNDAKLFRERARQRSVHQVRSGMAPESSGSVLGPARGSFWPVPKRFWPSRTPEDRSWGLFWASRTRPKRVLARSRNGFERPKPPKINFASIFRRFGLRFRRYSKDFSSNFFELPATKAQNRNLKKESRDPHFASWFWRGAVASYCLHVFRNDFRTLHAQPYLGACPQAHLV